ncbi:hypothetical protein CXG81DRAFT_12359 [Caulochytrium protostelioides]|uniref:chitin synthase n=1 Tax=Caulochytrium protostelioides TaxID=1555241 RepID=A0A4P9X7D8_9FUNG|nr:hypothetical protein CXG81DRAFT_12359 [Caulochytrium protostelioides]|eukprot:RKP01154.1 hypothetical protein CXG81DRAFT_12359 [Caulochytrium protostelioides]
MKLPEHYTDAKAIVDNLQDRYNQGDFYTQVGDRAVIAIRPKRDTDLVAPSKQRADVYAQWGETNDPKLLDELVGMPNALFAMVENAHAHTQAVGGDHTILLQGESGAGKTETHKLIVRHLCNIAKPGVKKTKIQSQIIKTGQIMKAFAGASSRHGDALSQSGHYIEYQINQQGHLIGMKWLNYLLNKHLVTRNTIQLSNFNIFYQMIAGISGEDREDLHLADFSGYHYLNRGHSERRDTFEDLQLNFEATCDALRSLGVSDRVQGLLWQLLSAVLRLGNITFVPGASRSDSVMISSTHELDMVADLLGVPNVALEQVLTSSTTVVGSQITTELLSAEKAELKRDRLAVSLYSLFFEWLVEHINNRLCADEADWAHFIAVIDFPGIRVSAETSDSANGPAPLNFHDFLVNYANERLLATLDQQASLSAQLYGREHIDHPSTALPVPTGARDLVALFEAEPHGLLSVLQTEGQKGTKESAINAKLAEVAGAHACFRPTQKSCFVIQHFAGPAEYELRQLSAQLNDTLNADFVRLFCSTSADGEVVSTSNSLIRSLFSDKVVATQSLPQNASQIVAAQQINMPRRTPSMKRRKRETLATRNAMSQFQNAISEMLEALEETQLHTVVCVRETRKRQARGFDATDVLDQIQSIGLPAWLPQRYFSLTHAAPLAQLATQLNLPQRAREGDRAALKYALQTWSSRVDDTSEYIVGHHNVFMNEAMWRRTIAAPIRPLPASRGRSDSHATAAETVAETSGGYAASLIGSVAYGSMDPQPTDGATPTVFVYGDGGAEPDTSTVNGSPVRSVMGSPERREYLHPDDEEGGLPGKKASGVFDLPAFALPDLSKGMHDKDALGDPLATSGKKGKATKAKKVKVKQPKEVYHTQTRRTWMTVVWAMTWWIPSFALSRLGGMKRRDIQIAWREKLTLNIFIFMICGGMLFLIIGLGLVICPKTKVLSAGEISGRATLKNPFVVLYGNYYKIKNVLRSHTSDSGLIGLAEGAFKDRVLGMDVSQMFYKTRQWDDHCAQFEMPPGWDNLYARPDLDASPLWYAHLNINVADLKGQMVAPVVRDKAWIDTFMNDASTNKLVIVGNNLYDVSSYYLQSNVVQGPGFLGTFVKSIFDMYGGANATSHDATAAFNMLADPKYGFSAAYKAQVMNCMDWLFYVGQVDHRKDVKCQVTNYILLVMSILVVIVVGVKFLAAMRIGSNRSPEQCDKFVVIQIPCYTEGESSMRKTIDTLSTTVYDDKRKLLFIICDGMIIGAGNDRPTPRIVLDILGVDPAASPPSYQYEAIGEGSKRLNMGQVYCGLYEVDGHVVPYVCVVKTGKPSETSRPGNRGKRDSQMILMRFMNRCHFNAPMTDMEREIFRCMKHVIGVHPSFYEYVFMVDADTEVMPDSLNRLVSTLTEDSHIIGLCGETRLANEGDSWVTSIQNFEYYASQIGAKAFESLFNSVTCLPGCFSIYRLRSVDNRPLLIAPSLLDDYSECRVDTLHKKNLLELGEDRYLTTLLLKHFPHYKTKFTPDAQCRTIAPDKWNVLLSQRRRWINSTVHNLFELIFLPDLCGLCCFSMRFVVLLDLMAAFTQPAVLVYIGYLVYTLASDPYATFPLISIIMIAAVYGCQIVLFLVKADWQYIGWMLISLLAMPLTSFILPFYAFWHFDDFSWGNTRRIVGDDKKEVHVPDVDTFDPADLYMARPDEAVEPPKIDAMQGMPMPAGYASPMLAAQHPHQQGSPYARMSMGTPMGLPDVRMSYLSAAPQYASQSWESASYVSGSYGYAASATGTPSVISPSVFATHEVVHPVLGAPSDAEIEGRLRILLAEGNLTVMTKKSVRDSLATYFGVEMESRRHFINECIKRILTAEAEA